MELLIQSILYLISAGICYRYGRWVQYKGDLDEEEFGYLSDKDMYYTWAVIVFVIALAPVGNIILASTILIIYIIIQSNQYVYNFLKYLVKFLDIITFNKKGK